MCKFDGVMLGQVVTVCVADGQCSVCNGFMSQTTFSGKYAGHDESGFDVVVLDKPITCPSCGHTSFNVVGPCEDLMWDLTQVMSNSKSA